MPRTYCTQTDATASWKVKLSVYLTQVSNKSSRLDAGRRGRFLPQVLKMSYVLELDDTFTVSPN